MNKRALMVGAAFVGGLVVVLLVRSLASSSSTIPKDLNNVPTVGVIGLRYDGPIQAGEATAITIAPPLPIDTVVQDDVLVVFSRIGFEKGQTYTLSASGVLVDGSELVNRVVTFMSKYVEPASYESDFLKLSFLFSDIGSDPTSPLEIALPYENDHFRITYSEAFEEGYGLSKTITIELLAIINRPEQYEEYKQQLKQYESEALSYLKNNNIDVSKYQLRVLPELN